MQKRSLNNLSLKVKAILGSIVLVVFLAFALSFAYINHQKTVLNEKLVVLGLALCRNLAYNAELGVLIKNQKTLDELLDGVLHEEDVIYVGIFGESGQLLAFKESLPEKSMAHKHRVSFKTLAFREIIKQKSLPNKQAIDYYRQQKAYQISVPVILMRKERLIEGGLFTVPEPESETIGRVVLGMSLRSLYQNLATIRWMTIKYTFWIALLTMVLTFLFVKYLVSPILNLTSATERVAQGDFSVQISVSSSDEVGTLAASFNQMVKEIKLSRDKIEKDAKELSRLNTEMEDMLHIVSHDLRSPLINIQGFTDRLVPLCKETVNVLDGELSRGSLDQATQERLAALKKKLEEQFRQSINFITKGVEKMDTLLNRLLAISRVGKKTDPPLLNDLNEMLNDILLVFDHQLKQKGITATKSVLPQVYCRKNEINQVFSNLISNAINYMRPDSNDRRIEIGSQDAGGEYQFYVKDTGIGIDEENYERVFKMFTRIQEVDSPGEGIGLTYVRKIVLSHYGRIWVESKKGEGSTFYFTLPKAQKGV